MKIIQQWWFLIGLGVFITMGSALAGNPIIYQQKSLYQNISVVENNGIRCLVFAAVKGRERFQTCQPSDQNNPHLSLLYTRMSFAGLLLQPNPARVLVVGLGGGVIPVVMNQLYPEAQIDIVELDPAVVQVAKDYFHFREDEQMSVIISDARVFIKRSVLKQQHYDYIILDAFNGDYIPEHLMTREFLQEVKQLMTANGVLVANTFSTSRLYDHESVTYQHVFGPFFNFRIPHESGNRVIVISRKLPSIIKLRYQAQQLSDALKPYGIDVKRYPQLMSLKTDWDTSVRQLTDQYSPANLLR
ncbi:fused MFS/spermidine synthase [Vibrio salinus]|uniref:fused MFS/spermidine synthase n=1 Tax=Vibrio salinus TaxID=2899784 RepID=UPI001E4B5DE7|nr:fused MFS/spermidine synthase [Vibrio salinus]MCE0493075.1 fused MFS/spermidine synthase [Vibrio salinus]